MEGGGDSRQNFLRYRIGMQWNEINIEGTLKLYVGLEMVWRHPKLDLGFFCRLTWRMKIGCGA